jgi:hypothetical protein
VSQSAAKSDFVIVERRRDVRIIVSMPGQYTLADRRSVGGEPRFYPCRAVNLSTQAIALSAPVSGRVGERVFAAIDGLGDFDGQVLRPLEGGFVMSLTATEEERDRFAARIEWVEQFKNFDVADKRADNRFAPANPSSLLVFADGRIEDCTIFDISASGAAVASETVPQIGTVLALARVVGRVVRHTDEGFAIQFIERQSADEIEAKLSLAAARRIAAD